MFDKLSYFDHFLFGHLLVRVKKLHLKPYLFTDVLARKMNDSSEYGDLLAQYCEAMGSRKGRRCNAKEVTDYVRMTLLTIMFLQR